MYHLERRKTARGQAVVVLMAVFSFGLAGAGLGIWIGKYADSPTLASHPAPDLDPIHTPVLDEPRTPDQVNALAVRLGAMQAELLRLNALGERLVRMSGLDPAEFDFRSPPPQGGPEMGPVRDYTIKELASELGSMLNQIQDRQRKLDRLEDGMADRQLTMQSAPSGWPVRAGYISSEYGFRVHPTRKARIFHEGIDFASKHGAPVIAVAAGVVVFSGRRNGYGRVVDIRHANGLITRYAHNSANLVEEGDPVRQGQQIARVGSSGTATGPHVHFEVLRGGRAVDPMPYLDVLPRLAQTDDLSGTLR
ncbi:M23 family metallopeptidase [Thiobaca trueperi]|uniref:Peptidase M23-like protein n=1 Tax=Thiobaca trueperi TaxID=127458 RepID=A0A4R3N2T5_9GAMM|nr:M23 family metallopeptidase [Thiobaca trueperi]TCT23044.1 peptidase M23-like protein [Thiobaca trueperi]